MVRKALAPGVAVKAEERAQGSQQDDEPSWSGTWASAWLERVPTGLRGWKVNEWWEVEQFKTTENPKEIKVGMLINYRLSSWKSQQKQSKKKWK